MRVELVPRGFTGRHLLYTVYHYTWHHGYLFVYSECVCLFVVVVFRSGVFLLTYKTKGKNAIEKTACFILRNLGPAAS